MMRDSVLRGLAILLVATASGLVSAAPAGTAYQITGIVVNSVDGAPVPHCRLTATLTQRNRGPGRQFPAADGVDADERGRFSITVPSAGAWHLTASAPGYVSEAYDQHESYSSAIVLTPTAPASDLVFRLPPESTIRGVVLDEAGEAVRNARVGLFAQQLPSPGQKTDPYQVRGFTQTDDRGVYEFASLSPGKYRVLVEAKPWYANTGQPRRFGAAVAPTTPLVDPSLDVTYQVSWYPGVADATQADSLVLRAGDAIKADFHLTPIPATHLRIMQPQTDANGGRLVPAFPMLERMDVGVPGVGFASNSFSSLPQGQIDVGGLAPGVYRVRMPEQNSEPRSTIIEITSGSTRVVDFSSAMTDITNVTVHFDGEDSDDRQFGVELIDPRTGQHYFPLGGIRPMPVNGRRGPQLLQPSETSFQVPPGRYEVNFLGRGESYLTGLTAQGADVSGRFVTLRGGDAVLTLHTAAGRSTVSGIASLAGKPSVGASVLLIPAGLDDPGSFTAIARDQTNTDGSFELADVIPGQYILVAIEHGWNVNWNDPSTLRSYLTQGVPLEVHPNATLKQNLDAQSP